MLQVSTLSRVEFPYTNTDQEEALLKVLQVSPLDFEPLAKNCTQVGKNKMSIFTETQIMLFFKVATTLVDLLFIGLSYIYHM